MKKVGIITLNDNNNYGNRLQNYAVQELLSEKGFQVETIKNRVDMKSKNIWKTKGKIGKILKKIKNKLDQNIYKNNIKIRKENFDEFNKKYMINTDFCISANNIKENLNEQYDYFIVGSDQVWNPNLKRLTNMELLSFAEPKKRVAFSASFAVNEINKEKKELLKKYLNDFKAISVREQKGKEIIEGVLERKDTEVLVDPTMLLDSTKWEKISKKPKNFKNNRYVLNYFLGNIDREYKEAIEKVAKENKCEIINILDKKGEFYGCGPSEFLYLEKNAFLVCTDSFHSSVFAILFGTPFCIFERKEKIESMNSRLDTLLDKFNLNDRKFKGSIPKECFYYNKENINKILEEERQKANKFLINALDIR